MNNIEVMTTNIVPVPFRLAENKGYLNLEVLHPNGYTYVEIAKCYPLKEKDHFKVDYLEYFAGLKDRFGINKPFSLYCALERVKSANKQWWRLLILENDYHGKECNLELRPTFHSPKQMQHWGNLLHNLSHCITYWKDEIEPNNPNAFREYVSPWVPKE